MKFIHNDITGYQKEPLNKKSLLRTNLEGIDDDPNFVWVDINIYDDNSVQVGDTEIIFNRNKAYAVINRMHFSSLKEEQKIEVLKKLANYLFEDNNLPFNILALSADPVEHGISDECFQICGFIQDFGNLYTLINPNFEEIVKTYTQDDEVTNKLMDYLKKYNLRKEKFLDEIRRFLENAYNDIYFFQKNGNEIMIHNKKIEIRTYEKILGIEQRDLKL